MFLSAHSIQVPFGFFSNWFGNKQGEGFEFHRLAIALAVVLVAKGAGAFSLNHVLYQKVSASASPETIDAHPPADLHARQFQ
jgi:putative oxidoreductase